MKTCIPLLSLLLVVLLVGCQSSKTASGPDGELVNSTVWQIEPSLKYDLLCLVNVLTGDPFYVDYYPDAYAYFHPRLDSSTTASLANLRQVKDTHGLILSAALTLLFSSVEANTIDELIATVEDSRDLQASFSQSPYYTAEGWGLYEAIRPDLLTLLVFLRDTGFAEYWQEHVLPIVEAGLTPIESALTRHDVVREVEWGLGHHLASNTITVYVLYYAQPHGIKISGTRFLTDVSYGPGTILHNSIHEMMHPPYDYPGDAALREALDALRQDPFLMDKIENHDPDYGYNSFEGYVEENVVRALDHLLYERVSPGSAGSHAGFKQADGGMHVLSAALYSLMKRENYNSRGEEVRDFLIRMIDSGELAPGRIEALYNAL